MNKQSIQDLLASADVRINGSRPWDIQVLNERLGKRMVEGVLRLPPRLSAVRAHCYGLKAVQDESADENGNTLLTIRMPQKSWEQMVKRFNLDRQTLEESESGLRN